MLLILREEIVCLVLLAFLAFYYANIKIKEKGQHFAELISCSIFYVLSDIFSLITVNNQEFVGEFINNLAHYIFYYAGIVIGFTFFLYCLNLSQYKKYYTTYINLGFIPFIIYIISVFCFKPQYEYTYIHYSWGPLAFITYGLFVFYCLVGAIIIIYNHKTIDDRSKSALYPMLGAVLVSIVAQIIIPELLLTSGTATFLCLGIFIAMDNPDKQFREQALWDFATGLKNRNSFERDVSKYQHLSDSVGVVMADLNDLKLINDTFGHEDGDAYIRTAANILQTCFKSAVNIYRIGGDEFAVFFINPNSAVIESEMKQTFAEFKKIDSFPFPLSIAMGYCNNAETLQKTIEIADKRMYENKILLKQNKKPQ